MEEQRVTLDTAWEAKELGFDVECTHFYNRGSGWELQDDDLLRVTDKENIIEAPTQSLLQKWFRDKEDILILVVDNNRFPDRFECVVKQKNIKGKWSTKVKVGFRSKYEDSLEAGLKEASKLFKKIK